MTETDRERQHGLQISKLRPTPRHCLVTWTSGPLDETCWMKPRSPNTEEIVKQTSVDSAVKGVVSPRQGSVFGRADLSMT